MRPPPSLPARHRRDRVGDLSRFHPLLHQVVGDGDMHAGGTTMKVRDVFTKVSSTKVEHMSEVEMGGKWTKLDEETCTKK